MIPELKQWLAKVTGRKLPPPPDVTSSQPEAIRAKERATEALKAAESRTERVDRVVTQMHRQKLANGFGARLAYAYGLRERKGGNGHG